MQVIGNKVANQVKKLITGLDVGLAATMTKSIDQLGSAVKAMGVSTVFRMAHSVFKFTAHLPSKKIASTPAKITIVITVAKNNNAVAIIDFNNVFHHACRYK